ncbi:PEP/pyruvate-binding domain-containing protein [Parafrankia sp. EUN1f]|uniref:PEP/pyruvate-binding domain-containing protein n=1 Tax=Parafrankia sp. EUN1f TaxID=102897 RepID=UPI0001C468FB|nr:PEP/pyruvate-binding domain-containing protein [Parafrankia sp. EUN1f]EFC80291.1 pyruvate phosphate dikinase PEP/pyruvate-binding [Parafrankia sp. EUN1f]
MDHIVELKDCGPERAHEVGGKALGLGVLSRLGLKVPAGFVVTTGAYRASVTRDLRDRIARLADSARSVDELQVAAKEIGQGFTAAMISPAVRREVLMAYAAIGDDDTPVAVRSSATAEDRPDASFAGQQDTFLCVTGPDAVLEHLARCWAGLYTPQAISYRRRFADGDQDLAMAVVIQRMVTADVAGVMMTLDPASGDRSKVYVEAAYGFGEGVVKGDVVSDSYWVDAASSSLSHSEIRDKQSAHRLDLTSGQVHLVPVDRELRRLPALSDDEVVSLAQVGLAVQSKLGLPQDIEWAITSAGGRREVYLLQARPETVWSNRRAVPTADELRAAGKLDAPNVLHGRAGREGLWTLTNMQEAIPGVSTPFSASVWGPVAESANRSHYRFMGALSREEAHLPNDPAEWVVGYFYGRAALRIDTYAQWADRVPGVSGAAIIEQFFSSLPGLDAAVRTRPRYARAVPRLALPYLLVPRRMRRNREDVQSFWEASISALPGADEAAAVRTLDGAIERFQRSLSLQINLSQGAFQAVSRSLRSLCAGTSVDPHEIVAGYGGHEESVLIDDMWECSRGTLELADFVHRHGYHGWREGELSQRSWREDPSMVERQLAAYRDLPEGEDPRLAHEGRAERRRQLEGQLIVQLPVWRRPMGRAILAAAGYYLPMRGVSKVSFLQSLDVIRAAARRIGTGLHDAGRLDDPEDVFYLTLDEVRSRAAVSRDVIGERMAIRRAYEEFDLPDAWQGSPTILRPTRDDAISSIVGTPASRGITEARARVVVDVSQAEVERGEILVARDTDPAWASLIFLSSGLVADIGGVMSHTAVVARELGIPCVVNSKVASIQIQTGDLIRVDGSTGVIEILERAAREPSR